MTSATTRRRARGRRARIRARGWRGMRRGRRAVSIQPTRPTSTTRNASDGLRIAATIKSNRRGIDNTASVRRMRMASMATEAAAAPIVTPIAPATAADSSPTASETRAPNSARDNTSRPSSSVPNQCAADGAARRLRGRARRAQRSRHRCEDGDEHQRQYQRSNLLPPHSLTLGSTNA